MVDYGRVVGDALIGENSSRARLNMKYYDAQRVSCRPPKPWRRRSWLGAPVRDTGWTYMSIWPSATLMSGSPDKFVNQNYHKSFGYVEWRRNSSAIEKHRGTSDFVMSRKRSVADDRSGFRYRAGPGPMSGETRSMNLLNTVRITITDLRQTVHARYGGGMRGYAECFYISLLRTNTFITFVHDCDGESVFLPDSDELEFVRNDRKRLDEFRQSRDLPKEFHCDQTHNDRDFILGLWQGEVAYIHWIFHENVRTRFLNLGDGCAEVGYMMTLPEFRDKKICSRALAHTVRTLSAEGIQRIFCVVHDKNIASIKVVERAGFREFGKARTIGPFNKKHDVTV